MLQEKYEIMSEEMKNYYSKRTEDKSVEVPEVGQFYAVESQDSWHRVCVHEIVADGVASCWFIDVGDIDTLAFNDLHRLDRKFCNLPRQVMCMSVVYMFMLPFIGVKYVTLFYTLLSYLQLLVIVFFYFYLFLNDTCV